MMPWFYLNFLYDYFFLLKNKKFYYNSISRIIILEQWAISRWIISKPIKCSFGRNVSALLSGLERMYNFPKKTIFEEYHIIRLIYIINMQFDQVCTLNVKYKKAIVSR